MGEHRALRRPGGARGVHDERGRVVGDRELGLGRPAAENVADSLVLVFGQAEFGLLAFATHARFDPAISQRDAVIAHLAEVAPDAVPADQDEVPGTGRAVACGLAALPEDLDGPVVVTGASGGIGAATALMLAQRGAHVVLTDVSSRVTEVAAGLARADAIFIEELRAWDLYDKTSQAFAVFLPVKSVGVVGDGRRYAWVVALRAVETIDFMTAHWAHLPYDFLGKVSNRIINELRGVSRVVYDISGKPPATLEWE